MHENIVWLLMLSPSLSCILSLGLVFIFLLRKVNEISLGEIPKVSILVPFYNESESVLEKVLINLERQNYPQKLQIVLIDDGSTNGTPSFLEQWLRIPHKQDYLLLTRETNGGRKGEALDYALSSHALVGEVYVVVDSDTFIAGDGIFLLVTKLWSNPHCAAVCGSLVPENSRKTLLDNIQFYELIGFHGAIRSAQDSLGRVPILSGAFVAHRASAVKAVGGWSQWLVEDISWCWKALAMGFETGYATDAIATTQCPKTLAAFFRQRRRWARGRVEAFVTAWKVSPLQGLYFAPWFLITSVQLLFPPGLIVLPLLICFSIWPPVILSAVMILLYLLITFVYLFFYKNHQGAGVMDVLKVPMYIFLLEFLIWIPNIQGYFDEISGKEKCWLTR